MGRSLRVLIFSMFIFGMLIFGVAVIIANRALYYYDFRFPDEDEDMQKVREDTFANLPTTMLMVLCCLTGGEDWRNVQEIIHECDPVSGVLFVFFIVFFHL